jgi:hypothetical protein
MNDCKLYGPNGALIKEVTPQGDAPSIASGEDAVEFSCDSPSGGSARAYVVMIAKGEALPAGNYSAPR